MLINTGSEPKALQPKRKPKKHVSTTGSGKFVKSAEGGKSGGKGK